MKKPFKPPVSAETQFARSLRKIAKITGHLVDMHTHQGKVDGPALEAALKDYSKLLGPWAKKQTSKMLEQVKKSNRRAYNNQTKSIKELLDLNVAENEVGRVAREMMASTVDLIQTIPLRAAERAQKLSMRAVFEGKRAEEIAEQIRQTTNVSISDAERIARTEVARANALVAEARAKAVGAIGYIWRTTMDGAERHSHAEMNGKFFEYKKPPTLSDGTRGNPGEFINCRCYAEPVFKDED
jgi:SPP1 gp7 family putative phage head morphogenesis protein